MLYAHCDGPDCDNHWRSEGAIVGAGTLTVVEVRHPTEPMEPRPLHFCDWNCLLKFAARFEPPTEIPL